MAEGTVVTQFETIAAAAQDCDIIVGATALQIAAQSVAEKNELARFLEAQTRIRLALDSDVALFELH